MGSLGPSNSLWDREFDTILIDLDDTLYQQPLIPAAVRHNIQRECLWEKCLGWCGLFVCALAPAVATQRNKHHTRLLFTPVGLTTTTATSCVLLPHATHPLNKHNRLHGEAPWYRSKRGGVTNTAPVLHLW